MWSSFKAMDQIPRFRPQVNLKEALERALDELKGRDPAELAAQSGGTATGSVVEIACLGRKLLASCPTHRPTGKDGPTCLAADYPSELVSWLERWKA